MENLILHAATVFMGFFAIMNPVANVPVFLGLTSSNDSRTTKAVARRALLIAFIVITLFAITGNLIFQLFGLTLPALRITGGILVFLIGYHMLQGQQSKLQQPHSENNQDPAQACSKALGIAVSPLALPILAGPGTIATAMNFSSGADIRELFITISMFALLCGITYVAFISGERLVRIIGDNVMQVITRMMGLILAVIGTQMAIAGIQGAFHLSG